MQKLKGRFNKMARYRAVVEFDDNGLSSAELKLDALENSDVISIDEVESEVIEDEDDEEVAN